MAGRLMANFADALDARAAELAAAPDSQSVEQIVQDARAEAVARTEVPNTLIYQVAVIALGLALLGTIVAYVVLLMNNKAVPEGLIAIGAASIGALAGLLAPTPAS